MSELHLDILDLWHKFNDLPEPGPSHRNRMVTAMGTAICEAMPALTAASNKAFALQNELKGAIAHSVAQGKEIERLRGEMALLFDALGMEKYRVLWRPVAAGDLPHDESLVVVQPQDGRRYITRALFVRRKTMDFLFAECDCPGEPDAEAEGGAYWPEGWYEWKAGDVVAHRINDEVTHWAKMPALPDFE